MKLIRNIVHISVLVLFSTNLGHALAQENLAPPVLPPNNSGATGIDPTQNPAVVAPVGATDQFAPAPILAPPPDPLAEQLAEQKLLREKEKQKKAAAKKLEAFKAMMSAMLGGVGGAGGAGGAGDTTDGNTPGSISAETFKDYPEIDNSPGNRDLEDLTVDAECNKKSGLQVADGRDDIAEYVKQMRGHRCSPSDTDRLTCMVCNIYFEARSESQNGQVAAGQTVMSRLFSSTYSKSSDTVCKTVWKPSQYSWTMPSVMPVRDRKMGGDNLKRVVESAVKALCLGSSKYTNYYAYKIVWPDWARGGSCKPSLRTLGNHNFCRIGNLEDRNRERVLAAEGIRTTSDESDRMPAADADR